MEKFENLNDKIDIQKLLDSIEEVDDRYYSIDFGGLYFEGERFFKRQFYFNEEGKIWMKGNPIPKKLYMALLEAFSLRRERIKRENEIYREYKKQENEKDALGNAIKAYKEGAADTVYLNGKKIKDRFKEESE